MCTPIERMRCLMQRNHPGATPCKCGVVDIPVRRYKDPRGRMVTLLELTKKKATFLRDGGVECTLNAEAFKRDFRKVEE